MKKTVVLLLLLVLLLNSNIFSSTPTPLYSFSGKEITIDFKTTLEKALKNKKELSFLLIANFTDEELKKWRKQLKSDKNVNHVKLSKSSENDGWDVFLTLQNEINKDNAKILFSFSIKADYIIIENEKMLFNVFVSQHIPN
ncbi:MAG: hypothetical protein CMD31_00295 [Flavobacteriales bacterium]|nr:hypothetical protein [Flavobacteriales bacterium]|tara:strand:- start:13760 stop:14182 length:423 start_codon:yes stop_codon:yes gene_type:complete